MNGQTEPEYERIGVRRGGGIGSANRAWWGASGIVGGRNLTSLVERPRRRFEFETFNYNGVDSVDEEGTEYGTQVFFLKPIAMAHVPVRRLFKKGIGNKENGRRRQRIWAPPNMLSRILALTGGKFVCIENRPYPLTLGYLSLGSHVSEIPTAAITPSRLSKYF